MGLQDTISSAIQKNTPTVTIEDSLRTAIQRLGEAKASALAVRSGAELVGIVTEMDLMYSLSNGKDLDATQVAACMTACELISSKGARNPCVQLDESENVVTALNIMYEAGVHNLLVSGAGNQVLGVVAARDLLLLAAGK